MSFVEKKSIEITSIKLEFIIFACSSRECSKKKIQLLKFLVVAKPLLIASALIYSSHD